MAERSKAKSTERIFLSKIKIRDISTKSFASRFELISAQSFFEKFKGKIQRVKHTKKVISIYKPYQRNLTEKNQKKSPDLFTYSGIRD
jgi:hypothetical protein